MSLKLNDNNNVQITLYKVPTQVVPANTVQTVFSNNNVAYPANTKIGIGLSEHPGTKVPEIPDFIRDYFNN